MIRVAIVKRVGPYYDWKCPYCDWQGRALTSKIAHGEYRHHRGNQCPQKKATR